MYNEKLEIKINVQYIIDNEQLTMYIIMSNYNQCSINHLINAR